MQRKLRRVQESRTDHIQPVGCWLCPEANRLQWMTILYTDCLAVSQDQSQDGFMTCRSNASIFARFVEPNELNGVS